KGQKTPQDLKLYMYLEPDEFIPILTQSKGVQIEIHEYGALPDPENKGISLLPGTQSNIALRLTKSIHMKRPYGDCMDMSDINTTNFYKLNYSYGIK
ncbi:degenerin deg-1, partial [Biomphalaria pfeifferi]